VPSMAMGAEFKGTAAPTPPGKGAAAHENLLSWSVGVGILIEGSDSPATSREDVAGPSSRGGHGGAG
jgi:hypothetical protein